MSQLSSCPITSENMADQSAEKSEGRGREKLFTEIFIKFLENSSFIDGIF